MSHFRSDIVRMRALLAALLVCALALGQFGAAAAREPVATGIGKNAAAMSPHCAAMTRISQDAGAASGHHKSSGSLPCPLCCLLAGAGVLPERFATSLRVPRTPAIRSSFIALFAHEPESLVSPAVNGARAPPGAPRV